MLFRYKSFTSIFMKRADWVLMTLLRKSFVVVRSDAGVPVSESYSSRFPLTVMRVQCVSSFCGRVAGTICAYVTVHFGGTADLGMKKIVLVPVTLPGIPWARRPISFPIEWSQISSLEGEFFGMSCLYSSWLLVMGSNILFMYCKW
jgi:hypothetical protein